MKPLVITREMPRPSAATTASVPSSPLRILFVTHRLPAVELSAGDQRFVFLLKAAAERHCVDIVAYFEPLEPELFREHGRRLSAAGVNVFPWQSRPVHAAALSRMYDVVVFEFWTMAEDFYGLFRETQRRARLVVDTVDVHFFREQTSTDGTYGTPEEITARKIREISVYEHCDAAWVVTEYDRNLLANAGVRTPMPIIPVVVDPRLRPARQRPASLLFVGGFSHAPNEDAMRWFIRDIWPKIRTAVPEVTLTIVGNRPPATVLQWHGADGISVVANAPDVGPYLDDTAVSIAPLRYGAGMKGKVTGAMAAGVAVVTTSVGVQGLHVKSGEHLMIGDDADTFAGAVLALLSDQDAAERIGTAGAAYIRKLCGPDEVHRALDAALADLDIKNPQAWRPPLLVFAAAIYTGKALLRRWIKGARPPIRVDGRT